MLSSWLSMLPIYIEHHHNNTALLTDNERKVNKSLTKA